MSGRRLLDAARILSVSRSVAKHHFDIRAQQWDVFTQTSSLAKAVKNQTDRVTVTARAAYALSRRFNETGPTYAQTRRHEEEPIPSHETVQGAERHVAHEEGLEQDHHYKRSEENAAAEPPPEGDLHVAQEKAQRYPLPDGTIPPAGANIDQSPSRQGTDTFNQRPVTDAPKEPLEEQHTATNELHPTESDASTIPMPAGVHTRNADDTVKMQRQSEFQIPKVSGYTQSTSTLGQDTFNQRTMDSSVELSSLPRMKIPKSSEDTQGGDEHVQDGQLNQDVYYSSEGHPARPPIPAKEAVPEQEEMPEGINTDIFHSPRVASLINSGGREDRRKAYELKMKAAAKGRQNSATEARNSDTFSARPVAPTQTEAVSPSASEAVSSPAPEPVLNKADNDTEDLAKSLAAEATAASSASPEPSTASADDSAPAYQLRESRVPSSRIGRLWQYGGLATSMAFGAVGESFRRVTGGAASAGGSLMLSPANMERLVAKLSRMRGAALKLGQMMSFQDSKMLPPAINAVLQRVQDSADYMPPWQRNKVLAANLGPDWKSLFSTFNDVPIAAASIGQVHRATLASNGREVAVKIQYPGVRSSIDSDLNNLSLLLTASKLLPPGLFLDKTIANARTELGWECDYEREATCGKRFATLMQDETATFRVPELFPEACGPEVLTAELMHGAGVTKHKDLTQEEKDWIGTQILRLCLRELMEWRFMQTDPNWTNFLYNRGDKPTTTTTTTTDKSSRRLELLDFGASREFPESFTEPYIKLLIAASKHDRQACQELSIKLGYLTGAESQAMLTAHVDSILVLAEPFIPLETKSDEEYYYDFQDQTITDRVREKIGLMVRERLAPPPEETYSLHRKLSGAFLLCARLGSKVPARQLFVDAVEGWERRKKGGL